MVKITDDMVRQNFIIMLNFCLLGSNILGIKIINYIKAES